MRSSKSTNFRGSRGEAIFQTRIMDFCGNPLPFFDAHFMGDKFPIFDHIVNVVENAGVTAFFFAQVKTSHGKYETRKDGKQYLCVAISKDELNAIVAYPGPAYLIGIDDTAERAYITAVDKPVTHGFAAMPTDYELDCSTLHKLRDEVKLYWKNGPLTFLSRFSR